MSEGRDLTPKQAAAELGIHVNTMYKGIKAGWVPCTRMGKQWRIDPASLEALLQK